MKKLVRRFLFESEVFAYACIGVATLLMIAWLVVFRIAVLVIDVDTFFG